MVTKSAKNPKTGYSKDRTQAGSGLGPMSLDPGLLPDPRHLGYRYGSSGEDQPAQTCQARSYRPTAAARNFALTEQETREDYQRFPGLPQRVPVAPRSCVVPTTMCSPGPSKIDRVRQDYSGAEQGEIGVVSTSFSCPGTPLGPWLTGDRDVPIPGTCD